MNHSALLDNTNNSQDVIQGTTSQGRPSLVPTGAFGVIPAFQSVVKFGLLASALLLLQSTAAARPLPSPHLHPIVDLAQAASLQVSVEQSGPPFAHVSRSGGLSFRVNSNANDHTDDPSDCDSCLCTLSSPVLEDSSGSFHGSLTHASYAHATGAAAATATLSATVAAAQRQDINLADQANNEAARLARMARLAGIVARAAEPGGAGAGKEEPAVAWKLRQDEVPNKTADGEAVGEEEAQSEVDREHEGGPPHLNEINGTGGLQGGDEDYDVEVGTWAMGGGQAAEGAGWGEAAAEEDLPPVEEGMPPAGQESVEPELEDDLEWD